jgi:hypothetical protein
MPASGMSHRVVLVRTDVSEELNASIIRVTIGELERLAVTSNRHTQCVTDSCHPDDRGVTFLRNVGSYKSYTA